MKKTLKSTLILSFSLVAVLIVLSLSLFFNIMADRLFERYAKEQQKRQLELIASQVDELYDETTGGFELNSLGTVGYAALQNGYILHVQTANNEVDWDMKSHSSDECRVVLQHAEGNMKDKYPNFHGSYTEASYPIESSDRVVGTLKIGYYGPYSLSDQELELLASLNKALMMIGMASLAGAVMVGTLLAKVFSQPVTAVTQAARKIADGDYGVQVKVKWGTEETTDLVRSVNEMSSALKEDEKQKKQITSDVAHELRTPLTNLQTHMEAMMDGIWEPTTERLESCHAEILRLTNIVGQLQELYSLENGSQKMDKSEFEFRSLCETVFREFQLRAEQKHVELVMNMPEKTPVTADFSRLKQCLINLMANAIVYTPEDGKITVSYEKAGEKVKIAVKDSGIGIKEEDLPYLFDRFYRADKSRNKKTGGMGIGLSITKAIVEKHGGQITVSSKKNHGTEFQIQLPE